jgi:hypothetical protein
MQSSSAEPASLAESVCNPGVRATHQVAYGTQCLNREAQLPPLGRTFVRSSCNRVPILARAAAPALSHDRAEATLVVIFSERIVVAIAERRHHPRMLQEVSLLAPVPQDAAQAPVLVKS